MTIRIEGALDRDARYYRTTKGRALVVMHVRVGECFPIEVAYDMGESPEAHMAAQIAAQAKRRGALLAAEGRRIQPRTDHGEAVLVLDRLERVRFGSDWVVL